MTSTTNKPLINKPFFHFNLKHLRKFGSKIQKGEAYQRKRLFHDEYSPFFFVDFRPHTNVPVGRLISEDFTIDEFDAKYGSTPWMSDSRTVAAVKTMVSNGNYSPLMMADYRLYNYPSWKGSITSAANAFINASQEDCFYPSYRETSICGVEEMFDYVRMLNTFVHVKISGGNLRGQHFLTNMLFIAKCDEHGGDPKVLATVMVKKKDLYFVRERFVNNLQIPANIMELWVDNSVESAGSKLKPHFRKYLKNKFDTLEAPIRYFDDLDVEISKFKGPHNSDNDTIQEWNKVIIEDFRVYNSGRLSLATTPTPRSRIDLKEFDAILSTV